MILVYVLVDNDVDNNASTYAQIKNIYVLSLFWHTFIL